MSDSFIKMGTEFRSILKRRSRTTAKRPQVALPMEWRNLAGLTFMASVCPWIATKASAGSEKPPRLANRAREGCCHSNGDGSQGRDARTGRRCDPFRPYRDGNGVERDEVEALMWFIVAVERKHPDDERIPIDLETARDALKERLNEEQRQTAQEKADAILSRLRYTFKSG